MDSQLLWKSEYPIVAGVLWTWVDSGVWELEEMGVGPAPVSLIFEPAGDVCSCVVMGTR